MHVIRSPRTASRILDGRAVVVSIDTNRLFTLNPQGTRLWAILDIPRTLADLATALCAGYEVGEATAREDCGRFCRTLIEKGLLLEVA